MAALAVLVGALEGLNVVWDLRSAMRHGEEFSPGIVHIGALLAALLLIVGGVTSLVSDDRRLKFAGVSALSCVVIFGAIAAFSPVLSMGSSLLGVVIPALWLLVIYRRVARRQSATAR